MKTNAVSLISVGQSCISWAGHFTRFYREDPFPLQFGSLGRLISGDQLPFTAGPGRWMPFRDYYGVLVTYVYDQTADHASAMLLIRPLL